MQYHEHPAHPSLARWVRCFWTLRGRSVQPEQVVPDGCPEIILNLADPFERFDPDGHRELQAAVLLVGQLRRAITIAATGRIALLGIRFEPAGLFPLLGEDQSRILGARFELASLAPRLQGALQAAVEGARGPQEAIARLSVVLRRTLGAARRSLIERAVGQLAAVEGRMRIDALAAAVGLSPRTLERRFRREVGLTPKVFARILRFAAVLRASQDGRAVDWARLALDAGYCDQAHLIRDFRAFSGLSPTRWHPEEHTLATFFSGP